MKNIILSTDGTGNAGGVGHGSNVWRLHTAIDRQSHLSSENTIRQIAYYHDGVGSQDKKWLKILGGVFGYGLKRTIKELYTFLVNNYEPGDQIYLFGFSRGAYTVRLLAGMILACGILDKSRYQDKTDEDLEHDVEQVYRLLQDIIAQQKEEQLEKVHDRSKIVQTTGKTIRKSIRTISHKINPLEELPDDVHLDLKIRFMGVWDTVDAYAIPSDTLAKILDRFFYISFREHDNLLNESVESACHALSIDDQRRVFEPVLWRENPEIENDKQNNDHQRIQQVWFAGVHSNVGGGYPRQGMAWNTLEWMMLHARQAELRFVNEDIDQFTENKDVHDKMYNSRSGLGAYYVFKPRNIARLWQNYTSKKTRPRIHISVFERIATRTEGYAPIELPEKFEITATKPICADDENHAERLNTYCIQYHKKDIQSLQQQVSAAIKERNKNQAKLTVLEKFTDFIHRWSSYLIFFGMSAFWGIGFFTYEKTLKTFSIALFCSLLYWFVIWQISLKDRDGKHTKSSAFWRKVSSDKAWEFLKK
jgi:uncharacterized protein (DUF2235 family)